MGVILRRIFITGVALLIGQATVLAGEFNLWPLVVEKFNSLVGRDDNKSHLGPIISETQRDSTRILSIRPFWTSFEDLKTGTSSSHLLYPLASWNDNETTQSGSISNLIQYRRNEQRDQTFFQAFPFIFSYQSPEPNDSYFAVWPVGGVLKNRLFRDRISFAAWPLYVRTVKGDEVRTHTPYPFIQRLEGPQSRGFGLWPFYGHFERDNDYEHSWAAWPLHYHYRDNLDEEVPYVRFGILPFYHSETAAGLNSKTFGWPFFGYTREWDPRPQYSENRYFWPFLIQGRGEEKYVNRWLPVYSNETSPGREKKWYAWPFLKKEIFTQPGLKRDRTSVLFFVYKDEKQHFNNTTARLTTIWPLAGYWNDGNGNRQLQALDPLTVFFPRNEKVKENWSPLFAVYRFDERMGNRRHSILWDMIAWESDIEGLKALYLGPLYEWESGKQWQVLKGLVSSTRSEGEQIMNWFWRG
jgi:hypothetical protein